MTSLPTTAPGTAHSGLIPELRVALVQIRALLASGWFGLMHPRTLGWRAVLLVVGLVGALGDAFTTLAMMHTGLFEEANPLAAAGMGAIGTLTYVIAATAVCLAMTLTASGRPRGLYATFFMWLTLGVCVTKVWTVATNVALWVSTT